MIPYDPTQNNTFSYGYNYNIAYTVTGNRLVKYKRGASLLWFIGELYGINPLYE